MGAHYCTNGGTQRAARHHVATPPLLTVAHRCPALPTSMPMLCHSCTVAWDHEPWHHFLLQQRCPPPRPTAESHGCRSRSSAWGQSQGMLCCDTRHWHTLYYMLSFYPFFQVIAAEGEQKASRALKEASEVISESSSALQLRYLQVRYPLALQRPPVRRPRSDGRQARLVCRIGRMKGLFINDVIHVWFVFLWFTMRTNLPKHLDLLIFCTYISTEF